MLSLKPQRFRARRTRRPRLNSSIFFSSALLASVWFSFSTLKLLAQFHQQVPYSFSQLCVSSEYSKPNANMIQGVESSPVPHLQSSKGDYQLSVPSSSDPLFAIPKCKVNLFEKVWQNLTKQSDTFSQRRIERSNFPTVSLTCEDERSMSLHRNTGRCASGVHDAHRPKSSCFPVF